MREYRHTHTSNQIRDGEKTNTHNRKEFGQVKWIPSQVSTFELITQIIKSLERKNLLSDFTYFHLFLVHPLRRTCPQWASAGRRRRTMIAARLESNTMQVTGRKCHARSTRTTTASSTAQVAARCYYLFFLGLFIVILVNEIRTVDTQHHTTNYSSNWSDRTDDFEQPIVISSVHSTGALGSGSPAGPPVGSSQFMANKRPKPQTNNWPTFSSAPKAQQQSQQPSQEFDQSTNKIGQQRNNNSWVQQQQPPLRQSTNYAINADQLRQRQTPAEGAQTTSQGAPYAALPATSTGNRTPTISQTGGFSLIRDTSLLESSPNSNELDSGQTRIKQVDQQQLWMQSIRDNHVGPIRSRFNLPAGQQHQQPRPLPAIEGGFHMRAKPTVFNSQHQDWQVANNKAARIQPQTSSSSSSTSAPTTTTTTTSDLLSSRRNSKFTRQADQTTTPLPSSVGGDIATGNGLVTPIKETNLLLLANNQRFEIDAQAQQPQHQDSNDDQVTSNNHSLGHKNNRRPSANQKQAKSLFAGDEHDQSTKDEPNKLPAEPRQSGGQAAKPTGTGGWARLLPALYQRTIAGVFRRLTGAANQQQPQQQVNRPTLNGNNLRLNVPSVVEPQQMQSAATQTAGTLQAPSPINSLFASALSLAAQVIGQQQQQHQHLSSPIVGHLVDEQNSKQASQLHESMMAMGRPVDSPGLKQHANKKIIDSFVDLPASERRSSPEGAPQTLSKRADLATIEELKAEPRLEAKATQRKAKTAVDEWKQPDQVEESEEFETSQPVPGQQDHTSPVITHEELNANNHDNSMIEFDFRTTTEKPGQVSSSETLQAEAAPSEPTAVVDEEDDDEEAAIVEDEQAAEAKQPEPVKLATGRTLSGNDDTREEAPNGDEESELVSNNEQDDLIGEASENQEQPVFFYAPQSSHQLFQLMSRKPAKQVAGDQEDDIEVNGHEIHKSQLYDMGSVPKVRSHQKNHKSRPLRRPPIAPIEPNPFVPVAFGVEEAADDGESELVKPMRRRRPASGHQKKANQNARVPPIGLSSVKPALKGQPQQQAPKKSQVSLAPKPLSVLAPSKETQDSSAMMSPMSSSINVMDLDPSMTRLAHNKLIVAKYKPNLSAVNRQRHRNKPSPQQQYARSSSMTPPLVTTQAPVRRSNIDDNLAEETNHLNIVLDSSDREMRPTEPTSVASSLASAVLGSRVMTNKHISEIVSRWTRPMTSVNNKPTSSRLHEPSTSTSTSTTTTTTVAPPPEQAANVDQSVDLDGRAGQQQANKLADKDLSSFADSAAAHWRNQQATPSRNDKFNFSLMPMNNRERINPLMFPIDTQRTTNSVNATLASSNKNKPSRVRVTTSSTTTTTTTSTTTTTTRPPRPYRSTTSHSPRLSTSSTTTTTTTAPSSSPSTSTSTTTTTTTSTTAPKTSTSSPSSVGQAESLIGQIVRSQHKIKPIPSGGNLLLASPEHIKLRNQYLALVGGRTNNSLNSLSLLNNLLLHARSSPRPAIVVGSQPMAAAAPMDEVEEQPVPISQPVRLEEAAHEANRYQVDASTGSNELHNINEHSIVIMSDNHHQQPIRRTWPAHSHTPAALERPLVASMHYTSQAVTFEPEHQLPSTTMAPVERRHLEELVNGTRIRPSSQIRTTTSSTTTETSEIRKRDHSEQGNNHNHHSPPVMMTANHSARNNSLSLQQHLNNQLLDSQELAKLDDRAQALLMDLFDRDPAYSANLFAAHQLKTKQAENQTLTTPEPPSTASTTLTPTTERSGQPSELVSNFPTSPAPYDRPEMINSQVTPSSQEIHQPRSTDSVHRRHYDNQHETTTTTSPQALDGKSSDGSGEGNHRASMRNNQATIQALIRDFAKRNNASTTTTTESDLTSEQLDLGVQYARPTPPTTRWADIILENDKDNMGNETSINEQETTKFYAPFTSTTVAFQPPARYPSVDTLSPGRQKINKPMMETFSSGNNRYGPTTPAMSTTLSDEELATSTKLTETASNNDKVRSSIRNRVTSTTESYVRPETSDEATAGIENIVDVASGGTRDDMVSLQAANTDQEDYDSELINRKPTGGSNSRPVIIRSKPRLPAAPNQHQRRPQQDPNKAQRKPIRLNINNNDKVISVKPATVLKKRKKPTKKPQQTTTTTTEQNTDHLVLEPVGESSGIMVSGTGEEYGQPPAGEAFILRPSVVSNGGVRPTTTIIRKRPTYIRLPPDNIRIHDDSIVKTNYVQHNKNKTSSAQTPISIIMPMESVIKRKDQDIRTRPLTIIDQSGTAHDLTIEQANELPAGLTRVPGTSILHQNMVVTYKPGRPLNQPFPSTTPTPFVEPINGNTSLVIQDNELEEAQRRPQLGSGNGGDTLLVSIEQQEALKQQAAARRTTTTTTVAPTTEEPATTTSTPAPSSSMAQRPIIVISGLNFGHQHQNGSHGNHHNPHRPSGGGGKHTGSSLVEAASNSVVASASHGSSGNHSRPWSGGSSPAGGVRHNNTVSSILTSSNSSSGDYNSGSSSNNNGFDFGASNLTDSIVPPEMPNFGSSGSSWSSSSSSSHSHSSSSSGNPHIGMPNLGQGSSLFGSRPGSLRPQSWRRRRPNGQNSSANNLYDYQSASSVSSIVYRPISSGYTRPGQNLAQLFNFPTLSRLYENIVIFFTRIRTFLISLLVVFLPPLALTASIVNVMSS